MLLREVAVAVDVAVDVDGTLEFALGFEVEVEPEARREGICGRWCEVGDWETWAWEEGGKMWGMLIAFWVMFAFGFVFVFVIVFGLDGGDEDEEVGS